MGSNNNFQHHQQRASWNSSMRTDWRSTLLFQADNVDSLPIELFLSIMEREAADKSEDDLIAHVLNHVLIEEDDNGRQRNALKKKKDWTEVKSHLIKLYGCEASVQHKTQLLRSLSKGPGENCHHYLIRVRYVASLIHCHAVAAAGDVITKEENEGIGGAGVEEWTRILFLAGLQEAERNFCYLNIVPDLDMLADLLNLNIKTESDDFPGVEVKMEQDPLDEDDGDVKAAGFPSFYYDCDEEEEPVFDEDYRPPGGVKNSTTRKRGPKGAIGRPRKRMKGAKALDRPVACKQCDMTFPNKVELRKHKLQKHEEKRVCQLCKENVQKADFKNHCDTRHNGMQIKCEVCLEELPSALKLKDHIANNQQCDKYEGIKKKVAEGKVLIEENCKPTNPVAPLEPVVTHFKDKSKKSTYKCAICQETIEGSEEFAQHCEEAHGGRKYKCDMCDYSSRSQKTLVEHRLKLHHVAPAGRTVYHCRIDGCKFKSLSQYHLSAHIDTKHEKTTVFACQVCSKEFFNKHRLKWHTQSVHMGIRRFKCDKCDIQCDSRQTLKFHMDTHLSAGNRELVVCEECGSSHTNIATLRAHVKRVHTIGKQKVKCPQCPDKEYSCNASLRAHLRNVHQLDKKFVCSHCDRGFSDSYQLNTHVNVKHLKIKSFHCKICKIFCSNASNLTYHIATKHLGLSKSDAKSNRHLARQHEAFEIIEQKNVPKAKKGRPNTTLMIESPNQEEVENNSAVHPDIP